MYLPSSDRCVYPIGFQSRLWFDSHQDSATRNFAIQVILASVGAGLGCGFSVIRPINWSKQVAVAIAALDLFDSLHPYPQLRAMTVVVALVIGSPSDPSETRGLDVPVKDGRPTTLGRYWAKGFVRWASLVAAGSLAYRSVGRGVAAALWAMPALGAPCVDTFQAISSDRFS